MTAKRKVAQLRRGAASSQQICYARQRPLSGQDRDNSQDNKLDVH